MNKLAKLRPAISTFLMMMAVATTSTAISFLNQPVSTQLQIGMGQFTLYYSLMVAAGALTTPLAGQLIHKLGAVKIVIATAIWGLICMVLFSVSNSLWMFYIVGILAGALGGSAITLLANVIVPTYYTTSEAASLIGIVMAGSGVGSILYSAVIPVILEKTGIAATYRFIGIIWAVLLILSVLILGKATPVAEEKGGELGTNGMTRKEALRSPMLYMMVFSVLLLTCGTGLAQHWPAVLEELGYNAVTTGAIISFYIIYYRLLPSAKGRSIPRVPLHRSWLRHCDHAGSRAYQVPVRSERIRRHLRHYRHEYICRFFHHHSRVGYCV